MAERFPDVAWWCDRCGANLNIQSGFDDHHYIGVAQSVVTRTVFPQITFMSPTRTTVIIGISKENFP